MLGIELYNAITKNDFALCKLLVDAGADVDFVHKSWGSCLGEAIRIKDFALCELLGLCSEA